MQNIKSLLDTVNPLVFYLVCTFVIWAGLWGARRFGIWPYLERASKPLAELANVLPATLLGALLATSADGHQAAFWGVLSGFGSIALHHILKALPVPYQGALRGILPRFPSASLLVFCLGCSPSESQIQLCFVQADTHKIQSALVLCRGYTWGECPEAEQIRAMHREELRQCNK